MLACWSTNTSSRNTTGSQRAARSLQVLSGLAYWYKNTCSLVQKLQATFRCRGTAGNQFACFTSTAVQILTGEKLLRSGLRNAMLELSEDMSDAEILQAPNSLAIY